MYFAVCVLGGGQDEGADCWKYTWKGIAVSLSFGKTDLDSRYNFKEHNY